MLVAIPSLDDNGLESTLSPHFGKCSFFVLVDLDGTEIRSIRTIANPFASSHEVGEIPNFVAGHDADAILAGGMGLRAIAAFASLGVRAVTGGRGTVRLVLDDYARGNLSEAQPCAESRRHNAPGSPGEAHE